VPTAD
jgi:hypothetical protein